MKVPFDNILLQNTLHLNLVVKAILFDLSCGEDDSTSISSRGSASDLLSRNHEFFSLGISSWDALLAKPQATHDQKKDKAKFVLGVFLEICRERNLYGTEAYNIIEKAYNTASGVINPQNLPLKELRIASKDTTSFMSVQVKSFALNKVPLHDLWDSLALVYTLCSEPIFVEREVELFLYQLRVIANCIAPWTGSATPSTLAVSWRDKPGPDNSLVVSYAFSVPRLTKARREAICEQRQHYTQGLHNLVEKIQNHHPNKAGNCPEITWASVCQEAGKYSSLCLSVSKRRTFKFCDSCFATGIAAADKRSIIITDKFRTTSLVPADAASILNTAKYEVVELKDHFQILHEGRGRAVKKSSSRFLYK
jgi:hypothetical protein